MAREAPRRGPSSGSGRDATPRRHRDRASGRTGHRRRHGVLGCVAARRRAVAGATSSPTPHPAAHPRPGCMTSPVATSPPRTTKHERCPVNAPDADDVALLADMVGADTAENADDDATAMRRQAATRPFVPRLAAVGGEGPPAPTTSDDPMPSSRRRATAPRRERMVGHTDKQAIADGARRRRRFRPGTTSPSAAEPQATDPDPPRPEQADESRGSGRLGSSRPFPLGRLTRDRSGTRSRAPSRCDDAGRTTRPHPAAGHDRSGQGWSQGGGEAARATTQGMAGRGRQGWSDRSGSSAPSRHVTSRTTAGALMFGCRRDDGMVGP